MTFCDRWQSRSIAAWADSTYNGTLIDWAHSYLGLTLMARRLTRPPRTPPHAVEPAKTNTDRPKPIRLRKQTHTIRLAPTALR